MIWTSLGRAKLSTNFPRKKLLVLCTCRAFVKQYPVLSPCSCCLVLIVTEILGLTYHGYSPVLLEIGNIFCPVGAYRCWMLVSAAEVISPVRTRGQFFIHCLWKPTGKQTPQNMQNWRNFASVAGSSSAVSQACYQHFSWECRWEWCSWGKSHNFFSKIN